MIRDLRRSRSIVAGLALLLAMPGCRTTQRDGAELLANTPGQTRPTWIKSPEAIEGTITQAWGIRLTEEERWRYLDSIYSLIGGTLVHASRALVDQPNELFVMGLDNLSLFVAGKLIARQGELEAAGTPYLFDGLNLSTDDAGCFTDDASEWCDFKDGVTLGTLTAANADVEALPKALRKRLMHNIQDVGEFMLLSIDNQLMVPGTGQHAAAWILDQVFLPELRGKPLSPASEAAAWQAVTYAILMSGGFYLEAPANPPTPTH